MAIGDQEGLAMLEWLATRRILHYLLYNLQIFILLILSFLLQIFSEQRETLLTFEEV